MPNLTLSNITKYRIPILILALIGLITLSILIFTSLRSSNQESPQTTNTTSQTGLKPQTEFKSKDESIRIDYSPGTKAYWVYIDAKSVEEYTEKRKEAVKQLKKLNIDPCNYKTTFWPIPGEIKTKFTANDLKTLRDITCPR